ncbi:MFS transporter [Nocardioides sp. AE5]|uniref:MFS transporter n=1 Tax=Nocardioides sp. AE5 TaxID=2962573 RepID=UPI002880F948|nr:MFS transporter [Nocardioides sp. AE5]MDT0201679.1 MFS transporter [Nocardioides sp. AE5]
MTTAPVEPSTSTGYLPGSSGYRRVMVAMFAAGLATFMLLYSTQALLPAFVDEFGVTPTQSTLTISLTTAALAVALLVAGPISEVVGRTRLIHLSLWASVVVALGAALAPNWGSLVALRVVAGFALAGLPAVATAYLREELHPRAAAGAVGLYIGGTAMGGMAGRLATAPINDIAGWRWALACVAVAALACAVVVALWLPASRNFVGTPRSPGRLAATTRAVLADRALVALYALGATSVGSLVAVLNALGFRLTADPWFLSLGVISLVYLVYPLGSVSSIVAGRFADRIDRREIIPVGLVLGLLGIALTAFGSLPLIISGVALLTIGFFCMHSLASGWVTVRAHALGASTGQAASFYLFTYYVGSSLFGNLGATAWSHGGWDGVALLAAALLLVSGAMIAVLRRTRPPAGYVGPGAVSPSAASAEPDQPRRGGNGTKTETRRTTSA